MDYEKMTDDELTAAVGEALGIMDREQWDCWGSDVGAAMGLLDKWANSEPDTVTWDLTAVLPGSGDSAHVECRLCPLWDESREIIGTGDNVQQAICIAFLKARASRRAAGGEEGR